MIPMLFYLMLKRLRKANGTSIVRKINKKPFAFIMKVTISILVFMLFAVVLINAKAQQFNYRVIYDGDNIGWLKVEKTCDNDNYCKLILTSESSFRVLLSFKSSILETSFFLNGKMLYSSQYHKLNNNIKANKKTMFDGKVYKVIEDNESQELDIPDVGFNLMCMYFQEPVSQKKVYCDKQESFSDIEKTADGGYYIRFPDGNSNCYYYNKGICTRVKVVHSLYSIEFILNP